MTLAKIAIVFSLTVFICAGSQPPIYQAAQEFKLGGSGFVTENVSIRLGPAEITLSGALVPESAPVHGVVFVGRGTVRIDPPSEPFERDSIRRALKADAVESDFRSAVFRFNGDTWEILSQRCKPEATLPESAAKLAKDFNARLLKETGVNVAARLAAAVANRESNGLVVAQFDGGRRGRFTLVLDPEGRIPSAFGLNAGETGLVFAHHGAMGGNDIWQVFPGKEAVPDLVRVHKYTMTVDAREVKSRKLSLEAVMDVEVLREGLSAIPFSLNEGLEEYDSERLKKALRAEWVKADEGTPLEFVQEDWDAGLTVFLAKPAARGTKLRLAVRLAGEFIEKPGDADLYEDAHYPRSTMDWYPVHGYLPRSAFDITFLHREDHTVVSLGSREQASGKTRFQMEQPVAFNTFAVGSFNRSDSTSKQLSLPISYFNPGQFLQNDKQTFMLTELSNCAQFFSALFGKYPYPTLSAVVHPRGFGQGFATLLLLPPLMQSTNKREFAFVAHEMAHQWWGNSVAWATYKDQWLSEGFAEYSGMLYVAARMNKDAQLTLVRQTRLALTQPPITETGVLQGRVAEIGPIILGLRAATPDTLNAYTRLVYDKGALVLRMLHFLLTHPVTGDDTAFYAMLKEFVTTHQGRAATTASFAQTASSYFARSPLGQKYRMSNLDWFFRQWVLGANLPGYRMEYKIEPQGSGVIISGVVKQINAQDDWFMPLPLLIRFGKGQEARGTVHATGPVTPFSIPLPMKPSEVVLDPDMWVLSDKTETVGVGN